MICNFCESSFTTSRALNHHKKTAKFCLNKRGCQQAKYTCLSCDKILSTKYRLNTHKETCITYQKNIIEEKYEKQIQEYKQTIKDLQNKLENIAIQAVKRPTTVKNTQINNFIQKMEPISNKYLTSKVQHLTLEHIEKGASGYAEYALEYPLKDRIACVDYSRRKIKFKDQDGKLISDPEMVKLAPMFFNAIKDKSSELVYTQNTPDMDSLMFERVAKLFNINSDVRLGSDGVKSDFYHDFVKHVCSGSVMVE